jgi:hypothetical protein
MSKVNKNKRKRNGSRSDSNKQLLVDHDSIVSMFSNASVPNLISADTESEYLASDASTKPKSKGKSRISRNPSTHAGLQPVFGIYKADQANEIFIDLHDSGIEKPSNTQVTAEASKRWKALSKEEKLKYMETFKLKKQKRKEFQISPQAVVSKALTLINEIVKQFILMQRQIFMNNVSHSTDYTELFQYSFRIMEGLTQVTAELIDFNQNSTTLIL